VKTVFLSFITEDVRRVGGALRCRKKEAKCYAKEEG